MSDNFGRESITSWHKQQCEELRKIRVKMAKALGVPEVVRKESCNFQGECSGTCPACYMEERALMDRIYELSKNGMMDMLFEDTAKEIQDHAFKFDTDNMIPVKPVVPPNIRMPGLVTLPKEKQPVVPPNIPPEEKKNSIKIPDFLKGKKK